MKHALSGRPPVHRRRRSVLTATLAAALTATVAAGCGGASSDTSSKDQAVLTMLLPAGTIAKSMQPIVEAFAKESGTKVNAIVLPVNDLRSRQVLSLNQKSDELDVVMLDDSWLAEVRNHLVPLNDKVDKSETEGYVPSVVDAFTQDGQMWALPSYMSTRTIFYRTDLLEKAGIAVPKTFDELSAAAKKLTNGKTFGFVGPLSNSETYVNTWAVLAYNAGMEGILDSGNTKAAFNDEGGIAALKLLGDMYRGGNLPPDSVEYGMEQVATAMYEGRAAMGMLSTPFVAQLSDSANTQFAGKFRMMPMPQGAGKTSDAYITTGWGFAMSKHGKDQAEALKLLRFINGKFLHPGPNADPGVITAPASNDAFASEGLKKVFVDGQDQLIKDMMTKAVTRPHVTQWSKIVQVLGAEMQKVFLGNQSAEQALSNAEKQVNEIMGKS